MRTTPEERKRWLLNWSTDVELYPEDEDEECGLSHVDALRLLSDASLAARFHTAVNNTLDSIIVRGDAAEEPIRIVLQALLDKPLMLDEVVSAIHYGEK
jgi:hypothetical protein